jgi:beta-lactamase regulating signal transducer with metallopeptidase domain
MMDSVSNSSMTRWKPDVIVFIAQVVLLFIVVTVSLVNLTLNKGNHDLWIMTLTSCLGYMLPNPRMKKAKEVNSQSDTNISSTITQHGDLLRDLTIQRQK